MPKTRKRTAHKAATKHHTPTTARKIAETRVQALIEGSKPAIERAQAFASETGHTLSKQTKAIRKDIAVRVSDLSARVEKQTKVLRKDIAHRVSDIGVRVENERKSLGRKVEGAVKTTLASLNIPTRSEINLLARRVEELSRKIDSLKRR